MSEARKPAPEQFVVVVGERIRQVEYLRDTGMAGILQDLNGDGVYDTLQLLVPRPTLEMVRGGRRMNRAAVKPAVEAHFSGKAAISIGRFSMALPPDDSDRLALIDRTMREVKAGTGLGHVLALQPLGAQEEEPEEAATFAQPEPRVHRPLRANRPASRRPRNEAEGGKVIDEAPDIPGQVFKPRKTVPLVLDGAEREGFERVLGALENRYTIFEEYGLGRIMDCQSICSLFYGPSGTGKTQAAKAIASRLGLNLLVVDHGQMLGKYVGETEKQIDRAFEYAEKKGCVLLVDEADSLLRRRDKATNTWEVSHVNVVLQAMENRSAMVLFATNFEDDLDPAINRRLLFKVRFGLPGEEARHGIWKALLTRCGLAGEIDIAQLASIRVTGGEIRNAIAIATVEAARSGELFMLEGLVEACRIVTSERLEDPFLAEARKQRAQVGIGFSGATPTKA
jgi:hypothetical protein